MARSFFCVPVIEAIVDSAPGMARPTLSMHPRRFAFELTGRLHALKEVHNYVAQPVESVKERASAFCFLALIAGICGLQVSIPVRHVRSAALIPDADRIVTVGSDMLARILNISRAEAAHELHGNDGRVNCAAAYSGLAGATIVSGGEDGTLRFCDAKTGDATAGRIFASEGGVAAVAASKDGLSVASASSHGDVRRWSTRLYEEAGILAAADGKELDLVDAVATSADGRCAAAGIRNGQVCV